MANAFMTSAARSKREQTKIQEGEESLVSNEDYKTINIRIPATLHHKVVLHRAETGENATQLIRRLLKEELDKYF